MAVAALFRHGVQMYRFFADRQSRRVINCASSPVSSPAAASWAKPQVAAAASLIRIGRGRTHIFIFNRCIKYGKRRSGLPYYWKCSAELLKKGRRCFVIQIIAFIFALVKGGDCPLPFLLRNNSRAKNSRVLTIKSFYYEENFICISTRCGSHDCQCTAGLCG